MRFPSNRRSTSDRRRSESPRRDTPRTHTSSTTVKPTTSSHQQVSHSSSQTPSDSTLPGYAQSTIAYSQRAVSPNGRGSIRGLNTTLQVTLKAGAGKTPSYTSTSRPGSKRLYAAANNNNTNSPSDSPLHKSAHVATSITTPKPPLKKRPSFVGIFRTNSTDTQALSPKIGSRSGQGQAEQDGQESPLLFEWNKSPGYKSPKLIQPHIEATSDSIQKLQQLNDDGDFNIPFGTTTTFQQLKFEKDDLIFQSMFQDMESALQDVLRDSEEKFEGLYNTAQLKGLIGDKVSVPAAQWEALVDYHLKQCNKFHKRLEADRLLITRVLEVNNELYSRCASYQSEIEKLKELLSLADRARDQYQNVSTDSGVTTHIFSPEPISDLLGDDEMFSPVGVRDAGTFSTSRSQTSASVIEHAYSPPAESTVLLNPLAGGFNAYKRIFTNLNQDSFGF